MVKKKSNLDETKVVHTENYIRENVKNHNIADLKNALLAGGYTEAEINEGIRRYQGGGYAETPFSLDNLFKKTWLFFKDNFQKLFTILFLAWLPLLIFTIFNEKPLNDLDRSDNTPGQVLEILTNLFLNPINITFLIISVLALLWGFTTFYKAMVDLDLGKEGKDLNVDKNFLSSVSSILPFLFIFILQGIIIIFGFFLLIIPGIIFAVWYTFSEFSLFSEEKKGMAALRRSKELVKGRWWGVFGRVILISMLINLVSFPFSLFSFFPYFGTVINVGVSIIGIVFSTLFQYQMFKALKELKETA